MTFLLKRQKGHEIEKGLVIIVPLILRWLIEGPRS